MINYLRHQLRTFAFPILFSVVISFLLNLVVLRSITKTDGTTFKKLTANDVSIISNINESQEFSVARGTIAKNLIDGSLETLAAPASYKLDYSVTLFSPHEIKEMNVYWKEFGESNEYVHRWVLEASRGQGWEKIASGEFPASAISKINKKFTATDLRLTAESDKNWIGIYEIDIIGAPF